MPLICPNNCKVKFRWFQEECPECGKRLELKRVLCKHRVEKCGYRYAENHCYPKSLFDLFECRFNRR